MNLELNDWDKDLQTKPEEEYQALLRTLKRIEGFDLLFVSCSPAEGERLIKKVTKDIHGKNIEALHLLQPVENFYKKIEKLEKRDEIDILFITGLEYSFYEYEDSKRLRGWNSKDIYSYSWKGVPSVLINLNQQRENFRDNFRICFVFLVPLFVIKYFIQRAPDFFDWRSGVFEFYKDADTVEEESSRILQEGDYKNYILLTDIEKNEKILGRRELLAEEYQTLSTKADLLVELGKLLSAVKDYEEAIASYDQALKIQPDNHETWNRRGIVLCDFLKRYEEAITSFDQVLKIKPDYHTAWYNQGVALGNLGRFQEAIASYDQALKIQPDYYRALRNRGYALSKLGRNEEAIASYDQALEIQPYDNSAWNKRGIALLNLGLYEEADASFNKAAEMKADKEQIRQRFDSLLSDLSSQEECNLIVETVVEELVQNWRRRLFLDCPEQSNASKGSVILWLLGSDSTQFETLDIYELNIVKQAMEYRYRILNQRYLEQSKERGYRNLLTRLGSLVTLRNKIQTWISLSRDRQRSVLDILQEVLQELLQSDTYIHKQMVCISKLTTDRRLQNALLFASIEEYCLRPVRNQPILVYRFVNYLRRTQRGGLTQVPSSDNLRLVSEEVLTQDSDDPVELLDVRAIAENLEAQELENQQVLRQEVKQEFENYLQENIGLEAVEWLRLYIQGKSQDAIAKKLNKPINEVYRLREKISYHAVRVFALKGKPELVDSWLSISLTEHNLGLTQNQFGNLIEQLTPMQRQILELRKAGEPTEAIALQLKLKTHQVMGEWTKVCLLAQSLRTQQ